MARDIASQAPTSKTHTPRDSFEMHLQNVVPLGSEHVCLSALSMRLSVALSALLQPLCMAINTLVAARGEAAMLHVCNLYSSQPYYSRYPLVCRCMSSCYLITRARCLVCTGNPGPTRCDCGIRRIVCFRACIISCPGSVLATVMLLYCISQFIGDRALV